MRYKFIPSVKPMRIKEAVEQVVQALANVSGMTLTVLVFVFVSLEFEY